MRSRAELRKTTMEDIAKNQDLAWGSADEVTTKLIGSAEALGSNILLVSLNHGAMPGDMFKEQIRRFAKEVLPALQAHEVKQVTPALA